MVETELTFFEMQPEQGAVTTLDSPDGEGRKLQYMAPEKFRCADATGRPMIDYGVCVRRFA